jgi:putative ABC transport system permease protein
MKYFRLIWRGLWRKRLRTIFTLLSIAMAFALFGVLQGVNQSFKQLVNGGRLNVLVINNPSRLPLPLADLAQIKAVKGVTAVGYYSLMIGQYQSPGNIVPILAVDLDQFLAITDPLVKVDAADVAALRRTRTGALVTRGMAQRLHWKIGDHVPIHVLNAPKKDGSQDWTFDIVGYFAVPQQGERTLMLAGYPYFDTARSKDPGTVDQYSATIADASQAQVIGNTIDNLFANSPTPTRTQTERANAQAQLAQLGDLDFFVNAIVAAAFATLLLLTGTTLMQAYRERISEIAVLKTLGFTDEGAAGLLLAEGTLLSVGAAALGLLLAQGFLSQLPGLVGGQLPRTQVTGLVAAAGMGAAFVLAVACALPPAWKARRLSIVAALATR